MPGSRVRVHLFDVVQCPVSGRRVRRVAECALAVGAPSSSGGLSVVIADDETVRDLNRRHRGLDETTDVLSFSFTHQGEYHGDGPSVSRWPEDADFVLPPGEGAGLGEVVVSYPQAVRQARESGHALERELGLLVCHGVLHLLGYDHEEPEEEALMREKEEAVLARVLGDE